MGRKKEAGTIIREWLTEKLGNPVMPSKEKQAIAELDIDDQRQKALQDLQEQGGDYDARVHKYDPNAPKRF
jgi:hypothetical protein